MAKKQKKQVQYDPESFRAGVDYALKEIAVFLRGEEKILKKEVEHHLRLKEYGSAAEGKAEQETYGFIAESLETDYLELRKVSHP